MSALSWSFSSLWVEFFFLTISSAQILHIMLCWSKKDVEVSWYNKISSTLQCIVHSQSTFQQESFKNSLIDLLGLTMEKTNWFLWPFCSFSTAGCSTWLRDRQQSEWLDLPDSPTLPQAGHTRIIIKVTFAVRPHSPWGYPAAVFSGNEVSAEAFGYIQSQWLRNNKKVLKYIRFLWERKE